MKRFQNSRDAATDAPAPPTKFHRLPSASALKDSRCNPTKHTNAQKSTRAIVEIQTALLINDPAIRNHRKYLKTNSRPHF
jgi:hypothetical protein